MEECPSCGAKFGTCNCYKCFKCLDHGLIAIRIKLIDGIERSIIDCPKCSKLEGQVNER